MALRKGIEMPRAMVKDPDKEAGRLLFGSRLEGVNLTELERITGISRRTLNDYRAHPSKMPLRRVAAIARARRLTDQQIGEIVRQYWGQR